MVTIPEQYYTPTGEIINREKIVEDMIKHYQEEISGNITDFSEGSEIRNLLESIALTIYKIQYYTNLNFRQAFTVYSQEGYLDLKGLEHGLHRKTGVQATGFITVELPEVLEYDAILDDTTIFTNPTTGLEYAAYIPISKVNEDYVFTIPAGSKAIDIPVYCITPGTIGNTDRLTVTEFKDDLEIEGTICYNEEAITGGTDPEQDEDYRSRILANEFLSSFGSKNWYSNLVNAIDEVHDSSVFFEEETVKVYVNGYSKPLQSNILTEAEALLNSDNNHILGHRFRVYEPVYNNINLRITINAEDTLTSDTIKNRLQVLFNGGKSENMEFEGYNIGETVTETEIISAITSIDGVINCVPELMGDNGEYYRFGKIINQPNQVAYLNNIEIVFRED